MHRYILIDITAFLQCFQYTLHTYGRTKHPIARQWDNPNEYE